MRLAAVLTLGLVLGIAGPLAAQTMSVRNMAPQVGQTVPVVLGEVTNVTSHSAGVRTTRGEAMNFETDSRTVMPVDLLSGRRVKIEFHLMENGAHHAGRITVIEPGSKDWDRYDAELTMISRSGENENPASMGNEPAEHAANDRGSSEVVANNSSAPDDDAADDATDKNVIRSDQDQHSAVDTEESDADELPRTASHQPLLLALGLAALALGGVIAFARHRHTV